MEVIKIVCDIIKNQLGLSNDQIWIYNQKVNIPTDDKMYVVVSFDDEEVFGTNLHPKNKEEGLDEEVWMNVRTNISINTFSSGNSARLRKYEIIAAMKSVYSVQQQEKYQMQIAKIPKVFMDASFATPTQRLFSYHYEYSIMHVEKIAHDVDFYNDFSRADMSNRQNIKIEQ
jgi:hypothetical protein